MKKLMLILLLTVVLPGVIFSALSEFAEPDQQQEQSVPTKPLSSSIRVQMGDTVESMDLQSYLIAVLLGEIPADFEADAIMAQAVATRTYTLRKVMKQNKHADVDVCTVASCCQAFVDPEAYLAAGGKREDIKKIERAVVQTEGQVLMYQENLIEATYFSCSGGKTEDAVAVWGTDVPYLQSVESPGEESASVYEKQIVYSCGDFIQKLGLSVATELSADRIAVTYTDGGGVDVLTIDGFSLDGVQLRSLLSLPSTAFSLDIRENQVVITTRGNGHRVGMSQYGADAMAVRGNTYDQILSHYYPGTQLVNLSQAQLQAIFDKAGNL